LMSNLFGYSCLLFWETIHFNISDLIQWPVSLMSLSILEELDSYDLIIILLLYLFNHNILSSVPFRLLLSHPSQRGSESDGMGYEKLFPCITNLCYVLEASREDSMNSTHNSMEDQG
jgi:hypothetical protein